MTEDVTTNENDKHSNKYDIRVRCNNVKNKEVTKDDDNNRRDDINQKNDNNQKDDFNSSIRWPDLTVQSFIHGGCIYGLYLALFHAKIYTSLFGTYLIIFYF